MSSDPFSLWVYLSQSPLLWLTVTLLVYAIADAISIWTHRHPLANPVDEGLTGQLPQQDKPEARDHESTSRATTAITPSGG